MNEIISYLSQTYYENPFWAACQCCCTSNTNDSGASKTNKNQDVCLGPKEDSEPVGPCKCGKTIEGTPGEVCYTDYNGNACCNKN